MEKYSRFRDSGTGIQVFLTPVPPASSSPLKTVLLVPGLVLGVARCIILAVVVALWFLLSLTVGSANRSVNGVLHGVFGQLSLLILGFSLIKTERVSLKNRGRAAAAQSSPTSPLQPKPGDIILSNFSSWLDIIYAAIHFNPIFLLSVVAPSASSSAASTPSSSKNSNPSISRRRNAGASVVTDVNEQNRLNASTTGDASSSASTGSQQRLLGFEKVSLWKAISHCGRNPLVHGQDTTAYQDLSQLIKNAQAPLMIFPELVTSNNRGLLRMAPIFPPSWRDLYKVTGSLRMGKGQPDLFIMSIKHDPPTSLTSTSTHSVPAALLNPLPHIWSLASSMSFAKSIQVRQLDPAESPTSPNHTADPAAGNVRPGEDALAEAVGGLISSLSRLRRTGLGWEDKEVFLHLVQGGGNASKK